LKRFHSSGSARLCRAPCAWGLQQWGGRAVHELGVITVPAGEPLHIAYWGVLSGADSTLGEDSKRGVEIAIDDKGGKLLDHEIQLTQEDGLCTPEGGATAAQKLAADTTLVGLIGSAWLRRDRPAASRQSPMPA
jgi:branched-chain amino acid transport system substrate-binding protein